MDDSKYTSGDQGQQYNVFKTMLETMWRRRKVFYWLWPITFVLSVALILTVPRYYTCEVLLAPESQSGGSSSSLQALASSFGFDSRNMNGSDAIYPMIYPEIVSSPNFLVKLFDVSVSTSDDQFRGTYYEYLTKEHKSFFLKRWKGKIRSLLSPTEEPPTMLKNGSKDGVNVFCMSKKQWSAIYQMQKDVTCAVDKKTDVITFTVTAQDKLVCATLGDSVCAALQTFITEYRTIKNRTDLAYYEGVMQNAYLEYHEASAKYVRFIDSHSGMNLEQYRIEAQNLETEMQLKQAAYTSFQKQYLATQARLQESTPVFTVLQSASVPLKPKGPKRMLFVLAMLFLATAVAGCVVCKDQMVEIFL